MTFEEMLNTAKKAGEAKKQVIELLDKAISSVQEEITKNKGMQIPEGWKYSKQTGEVEVKGIFFQLGIRCAENIEVDWSYSSTEKYHQKWIQTHKELYFDEVVVAIKEHIVNAYCS